MCTQPDGLHGFRLLSLRSHPGLKIPRISAAWKEHVNVQPSRQICSSHKTTFRQKACATGRSCLASCWCARQPLSISLGALIRLLAYQLDHTPFYRTHWLYQPLLIIITQLQYKYSQLRLKESHKEKILYTLGACKTQREKFCTL